MFNLKTIIIGICTGILIILILLAYSKGRADGYNKYNAMYQEKLQKEISDENNKIKKEYDQIIEKMKKNTKVEVIYKDRVKVVKEIVNAENMQCKMTKEQIEKLNEFIKYKKTSN